MLTNETTEAKLDALSEAVYRLAEWLNEDQTNMAQGALMAGAVILYLDSTGTWELFPPAYPIAKAIKEMKEKMT